MTPRSRVAGAALKRGRAFARLGLMEDIIKREGQRRGEPGISFIEALEKTLVHRASCRGRDRL